MCEICEEYRRQMEKQRSMMVEKFFKPTFARFMEDHMKEITDRLAISPELQEKIKLNRFQEEVMDRITALPGPTKVLYVSTPGVDFDRIQRAFERAEDGHIRFVSIDSLSGKSENLARFTAFDELEELPTLRTPISIDFKNIVRDGSRRYMAQVIQETLKNSANDERSRNPRKAAYLYDKPEQEVGHPRRNRKANKAARASRRKNRK